MNNTAAPQQETIEKILRLVGLDDDHSATHPLRRYPWLSQYVQLVGIQIAITDNIDNMEYNTGEFSLQGIKTLGVSKISVSTLGALISECVIRMGLDDNKDRARFLDQSGAEIGHIHLIYRGQKCTGSELKDPPFAETRFVLMTNFGNPDNVVIYEIEKPAAN
jgi:hypothetical protein